MLKLKLLGLFLVIGLMAQAQIVRKPFNGFYLGAEGGYQYLFGSATVGDSKLTAGGAVPVVGGLIGWREETNSHYVYGAEFQISQPMEDFGAISKDGQAAVVYDMGLQLALQLSMGMDFLRNHLFIYGGVNQSNYIVETVDITGAFKQNGQQSFGRLGVGLERDIAAGFTSRVTFGTSFDGAPNTNNAFDYKLGVLYNF